MWRMRVRNERQETLNISLCPWRSGWHVRIVGKNTPSSWVGFYQRSTLVFQIKPPPGSFRENDSARKQSLYHSGTIWKRSPRRKALRNSDFTEQLRRKCYYPKHSRSTYADGNEKMPLWRYSEAGHIQWHSRCICTYRIKSSAYSILGIHPKHNAFTRSRYGWRIPAVGRTPVWWWKI